MFCNRYLRKILVKTTRCNNFKRTLVNNITKDYIVTSGIPDIQIPNVTLPEYLLNNYNKFEKYDAFECAETGRKYTYGDVRDKSYNLSKALRKILKLKEGDVVAIILENLPEYSIAFLGIARANLVVTSVSPVFTPDEISRQLLDSGAKAVITQVELHPNVQSSLQLIKKELPVIVIKTKKEHNLPDKTVNFFELSDLDTDYPEIVPNSTSDVVFMPYSSGTTGIPKGVELTHRNLVSQTEQSNACDFGFSSVASESGQELYPNILPFYHSFGASLLLGVGTIGGKLVTLPSFSQDLFIRTLKNYRSTMMYVVPPIVLILTYNENVKPEYLKHVKAMYCGGAPLGATDEENLMQKLGHKVPLLQGYGLTETAPSATYLYPKLLENEESYKGSVGRPVANTLIKVVNPDDKTLTALPPNETGEILIKGEQVMKGYHNLPEETKNILTEDGWLRSGDLGHYNNDGFIFITDRLKELIKVKGNQVAPAELEAVIRSFPGVVESAVIGIPHETSGEVPRAYIVASNDLNLDELNQFVNSKVAKYKQLKGGIALIDDIPKTPSGKILRKEMKEMYLKENK